MHPHPILPITITILVMIVGFHAPEFVAGLVIIVILIMILIDLFRSTKNK
jgi:hypothetical protein